MNSHPIIKEYIQLLTSSYDLEVDELYKIWTDVHPEKKEQSQSLLAPLIHSEKKLKGLKKTELQEICRDKNLPVTGTKLNLIARILGEPVTEKPKKKKNKKKVADVLQKICHNANSINIRRNAFENYEHADTGLVFDEITHKVIGRQDNDGTVSTLKETDMELCKEYGFEFVIPETIPVDEAEYYE